MPLVKGSSREAFGQNMTKLKGENYPQKQRLAIALNTQRDALKRRRMWEGGEVMDNEGLDWADKPAVSQPNNTAGEPDTLSKVTEKDPEYEEGWGDIEHAPGGRVRHGNGESQDDRGYRNSEEMSLGGVAAYSEGGRVGYAERGSTQATVPKDFEASGRGNAGDARSQPGTTSAKDPRGDQESPDLSHDIRRYTESKAGQNNSEVRPPMEMQMETYGDDAPSSGGDDMVEMAKAIRKKRRYY